MYHFPFTAPGKLPDAAHVLVNGELLMAIESVFHELILSPHDASSKQNSPAPFCVNGGVITTVELHPPEHWHVPGAAVGPGVGAAIGTAVGPAVGAIVGAAVGPAVGAIVGAAVGTDVGPAVGAIVGAAVGTAVGAMVGAAVGTAVAVIGAFAASASQFLANWPMKFSDVSEGGVMPWLPPSTPLAPK
jgi:hypothetical protein